MPERTPRDLNLPSTLWEGSFFTHHSLALVNRELSLAMLGLDPSWDLGIISHEPDDIGYQARLAPLRERSFRLPSHLNVTVRHHYPPDWAKSMSGKLVVIQPWEFGAAPKRWVEAIKSSVDELWCPTSWVRQCYIDSGVPAGKVFTVPNGVNTELFRPDVEPFNFECDRAFRFLFVGGTLPRKGADILLEAYTEEFSRHDDVALVIKEFGAESFYQGQGIGERIRKAAGNPFSPTVVYLTDTLSDDQLPSLYSSCDCLVHPYRGEGYGMPIAEAMACGKPVIVTNYGACLDFVDESCGYLVDSAVEHFGANRAGDFETAGRPFWAVPNKHDLRASMRAAYENRGEARAKGVAGHEKIQRNHTWRHAAEVAAERLQTLATREAPATSFTIAVQHYTDRKFGNVGIQLAAQALRNEPTPETYLAIGQAQLRQGDWAGAKGTHSVALTQFPNHPELNFQAGYTCLNTQDEDNAFSPLLVAFRAEPSNSKYAKTLESLHDFYLCKADWLARRRGAKSSDAAVRAAKRRAASIKTTFKTAGVVVADTEPVGSSVSICMIAKNEARYLAQALESVKGFADEVIVVDTGSSDNTVEIARTHGAKVYRHEWNDDFAEARNVSLSHASCAWVLWLDADEAVDGSAVPALEEALLRPQFGGYYIPIVNYIDPSNRNEIYTHRPCRLFRRLTSVRFEGRVHEQIIPSLQAGGHPVVALVGAFIHHFGYQHDVVTSKNKFERTIRMLKAEIEERPEDWFQLFNLGNTYYSMGDYKNAALTLERVSEFIDDKEDYALAAYHLWSGALYADHRMAEAYEVCQQAFERGIDGPTVRYSRAVAALGLERFQEAIDQIEVARSLGWADNTMGDTTVLTFKADYVLAQANIGLGKTDEAERLLHKTLEQSPNRVRAHYTLGALYAVRGDLSCAEEHLRKAAGDEEIGEIALQTLAEAFTQARRFSDAAPVWGELCRLNPSNDAYWDRWTHFADQACNWNEVAHSYEWMAQRELLTASMYINWGRSLGQLGRWDEALSKFADAIKVEPHNANCFFNAGDGLYSVGAYREAAESYRAGLDRDPDNADGWFVLGNALFQMGLYDGARLGFRKALALDSTHEKARNNLALTEKVLNRSVA